MATYNLAFPDVAIDAILTTAYHLQQAGYIFRGSASDYSGTPTEREWVIAPAGFTGLGLSSAVPQGSIGVCLYTGTAWVGKIINVLTLDSAPTRNSQNGVTSGGVAATLDEIAGGIMETFASLLFDDETASADLKTKLSYAVKFSVSDVYQTVTHLNILAATTSKAGLMSAEDKAKVDSFLTNLRSLTFADTTASADQETKITETLKATIGGVQEVIDSITLLAATSSKAGLLSASDKAYIDALPATLTSLSNSISGALALMQSLVGYYVCDTAAGTAAKTVAATGYSLTNGGCIRIKMTNANTAANATLNINSTGAKALYYDGTQASSTNTWEAGEVLEVYYDGTQYQCVSGGGGGKFATGEKVSETSIVDAISGNENAIMTEGAICDFFDNLILQNTYNFALTNEVSGISISNGKWVSQGQRKIYIQSYTHHQGNKLYITGNANYGSYYAFLTSDSHVIGDNVSFAITGQTDWSFVAANVTETIPIPSNTTYIAVMKSYSISSFLPIALKIEGIPSVVEIDDEVEENDNLVRNRAVAKNSYFRQVGNNLSFSFLQNGFVKNDGTTGTASGYAIYKLSGFVGTETFNLSIYMAGDVPLAVIFDANNNVLGYVPKPNNSQGYYDSIVNLNNYQGASYILYNTYQYGSHNQVDLSAYKIPFIERYPDYVQQLLSNVEEKKEISILFVGNSLTQDAVSYLPYILTTMAPDISFKFYVWYNAGKTLKQQYENYFLADAPCDIFSVCENGIAWNNFNSTKKMSEILGDYTFDIVCLQEYSYFSFTDAELKTNYDNCVSYIASHYDLPLKFITLIDQPNRSKVQTMYDESVYNAKYFLKNTVCEDIIPAGTATYLALQTSLDSLGDQGHLSPDGTHSQEGLPCLLQAFAVALWVFEKLALPISVYASPIRIDTTVYNSLNVPGPNLGSGVIAGTDSQNLIGQECAINAVKYGKKYINAAFSELT